MGVHSQTSALPTSAAERGGSLDSIVPASLSQ